MYSVGDGADTISDFNTGNTGALWDGDNTNNDFIDLSSFYTDLSELRADFEDDGVLNQSNDGVDGADYSDNTRFAAGDGITFTGATSSSFTTDNTGVVCFTLGTMTSTPDGARRIEDLQPCDLVLTRDNGPKPIMWIGRRSVDARDFAAHASLKPILVSPKIHGGHAPLLVSPQHGLLLNLDGDEVLVRAKHLAQMKGGAASVAHGVRQTCYIHLMLEQHEVIFANGVPSESFFPGTQAMLALGQREQTELAELLPGLGARDVAKIDGTHARQILRRHAFPDYVQAFARGTIERSLAFA